MLLRLLAISISRSTLVDSCTWLTVNAVPRSNDSVDIATLQPLLTPPTTLDIGMRTSS